MDPIMEKDIEVQTERAEQSQAATIFKRANRPVTLKIEDVVYKIKMNKGASSSSKLEEKVILKGITGIVKPGEMLAMLGPSGSGKTTLLTAMGGRLGGDIQGTITYNGHTFSNSIKRNIGFVTQDDVLYPHLTVTETLVFTALLRLPNTLTTAEKIMHAEAVITQLGLAKCKDNIVGGPDLRGVSGGERKRVCIGQELLLNPSLLFLDEPTSGLDSTTAQQIVSTLWKVANDGGTTVVMTIHQPSSRLFYMFHKVLLLSEGNPLYFGQASAAMDYFTSIGYSPSVPMNPSDFLLDLANGVFSNESGEEQAMVNQTLINSYKKLVDGKVKAELEEDHDENESTKEKSEEKQYYKKWSTTWWQQTSVLFRRGIKERRNETFSRIKIFYVLTVALFSGLLWRQSNASNLHDQVALLYFYCDMWGFSPMLDAIFAFPQERMMLEKERSSGMYELSSYFIARIFADLPVQLILPTVFVSFTYYMAGFKLTIVNFCHTLFIVLYSFFVSQGLGLAIGALVMKQKSAIFVGDTLMLSFLLTSGFYIQNVPGFMAWIRYISVSHHTYKLLLGSQYKVSDTYPCRDSGGGFKFCKVGEYPEIKTVGLDGQVVSVIVLAVMLVIFRVLAYIALMRIGVTRKQRKFPWFSAEYYKHILCLQVHC